MSEQQLQQQNADPETDIDRLIEALQDPVLEVRARAYQLLQSIDSARAKAAIANGVPLKQGDTLYCVYEITVGYNDETYYSCTSIPKDTTKTGDYRDVIEPEPSKEIDWETLDSEEFDALMEESETPRLVSRYLSREKAEGIAELLHEKQIIAFDTPNLFEFDWIHKGKFDVNAWCVENGLSPTQLPDQDWWEAGHQLAEKLKAKQQIELLSKLWKDTAGQLAIVHEQVINRNCYFKVTQSL